MESNIIFLEHGPFHLPTAQRATAVANTNNGVTVMLFCDVAGRGEDHEPVSVQMVSSVARDLAMYLLRAADESEGKR